MKRYIKSSWILTIMLFLTLPTYKAKAQPNVSVSFSAFYDALSPYGRWIDAPGHGYVWTPNVSDFRPYYSGGHWVMTEYGNTWVSDYDWGWAPFHYGRWTQDPYYGWIWVPDNVWGPAWVTWRNGGGYYGWAPMAPGVSINVSFGPGYHVANDWWVFIPNKHIYSSRFHSYYRGPRYNTTIINRTTIINNTYVYNNNRYITGPRRDDVQRRTGQRVVTYNLRDDNRPGRSNINDRTVNIYRPRVEQRREGVRPQQVTNENRSINDLDRTPRNAEQRVSTDRTARNDRVQQTAPDRVMQSQSRSPASNREARNNPTPVQARNQQAEQQRQNEMQTRERNQQRQNDAAQRQRQVQQRAEQQQRIEQNRQQHFDRRQGTNQRAQPAEQRNAKPAPQQRQTREQPNSPRQAPSRTRERR